MLRALEAEVKLCRNLLEAKLAPHESLSSASLGLFVVLFLYDLALWLYWLVSATGCVGLTI